MTAAILATDLHKQFGDNHAVAGIDLAVEPGEIYGFLGPNGAGKSTTMKVLCTLLTPTSGSASVAGFDVVDHPGEIRLRIGVALQDSSIDGKQTGRELLKLQGRLYGLSAADIKRRMDDVIGLVDIGTAIDDRVESYSGGMKRRLDLAMSLIHRPQILFLDEPTTGLDPVSRNAVWSEVRDLNTPVRRDDLPHHPVPRGGRRAGRPGRHHRQGRDRRRRDTGRAEAHDRHRPDRRRGRRRRRAARRSACARSDGVDSVEVRGQELTIATADGSAIIADVAVALEGARRHGQVPDAAHADARRRVPRRDRRAPAGQPRTIRPTPREAAS